MSRPRAPGLDPREVEQVGDEPAEPFGLGERDLQASRASGSVTPSTRFSSWARSAATGVRSSCETLAISSRRSCVDRSRSSAIWLNACASWPTSSRLVARTRRE